MERTQVTFTFEKCLGRGGYGEVYLATRTRPGGLTQRVAVKVLRNGITRESQAVRRLRDEGRVLAMLDHPAILGVLEMTRLDGRVALVTEYVEGVDVARCCRRGFLLPPKVIAGIVGEVAAALHSAASTPSPETGKPLALIHRDIKPENIRLSKHGEVKLLDFGIARTREMDREAETVAGTLPFTRGYAAPECFNEGLQSAASDVFALGATLFRMLAGERLFEGLDAGTQLALVGHHERYARFLDKRLRQDLVAGREPSAAGRASAAPGFQALLRSMLAFDAAARPTAAEVQARCEALSDALDGPNHVRWARGTRFSEPHGLPGAELTGRTLVADEFDADEIRTQKMRSIPSAPPAPPPVPEGLASYTPPPPPFTALDPKLSLDGLPVPAHGLATLPPGGARVADLQGASELETPALEERGGVGLAVKLAAVAVVAAAITGLLLAFVVAILWMLVG